MVYFDEVVLGKGGWGLGGSQAGKTGGPECVEERPVLWGRDLWEQ